MLSVKPWKPEAVLRLMIAVFVSMSLASLATAAALPAAERETASGRFLMLLAGTVGFHWCALLLIALFVRAHETRWRAAFGLDSGNNLRSLGLGLGAGAASLPACWLLGQGSAWALTQLKQRPEVQFTVQTIQVAVAQDQQVYAAFATVVLAPVVEELLFRGVLYPAVKQLGHPHLALWGTSLFFAIMHANAMTFLPLVLLSLVLTWLYEKTGNLLAPVAAHLFFNLANLVMLTFQPQIEQWLRSLK
jgi:membrane protease YdiL (CAAX protease family)